MGLPFTILAPVTERRVRATLATLVSFAVLVAVISKMWQFGIASPFTDPLDFRAVYCAGSAVMQRADPYRVEPNRSCQRHVFEAAGLRFHEDSVLPAPLPPYALVGFAALALLPFRIASAVWMAANIVALIAAVVLVSRLSGTRPIDAGLALVLPAGIVSLSLGQAVPLVLAALLIVALSVRHGNRTGVAIGAAIAAVEPHLALPVWLALAFCVPAARVPLLAAASVLGALTLVPGAALNVEYIRSILPAHARAELPNFEIQYSLSSLLGVLHVPSQDALRAGSLCYAAMLAFGITLGAALWRRFADPAFLILAPLAAVVAGGAYVHLQQTVVAIPLGFMLVARLPRFSLGYCTAVLAIVLLAIPWPLGDIARAPAPSAARVVADAAATAPIRAPIASESMEIPYAAFTARFARRPNKHTLVELIERKLPTWLALLALLTIASALAFAPPHEQNVRRALHTRLRSKRRCATVPDRSARRDSN